jgi:Spy/CpxP family protein refolding chaperone
LEEQFMTTNRGICFGWFARVSLLLMLLMMPAVPSVWGRQADPDPGGGPGAGAADRESMRDDLQETIEIYMVARMKRSLNLTDQQERVVIPLVEELNSSRREMNKRRRLTVMKLRPLLEDQTSPDQEIAKLVGQLDDADRHFRDKELENRQRIRQSLSPRQLAQFILFMERFRQEMEDRLRRIQQGDGPGPGPGGPRRNPPPPSWQRPRR